MRAAGLNLELAVNILGAVPYLASAPDPVIDYRDTSKGLRSLLSVDPDGGWLPTDIVPWHVWERFVLPCREVDNPAPQLSELCYVDLNAFHPTVSETTITLKMWENDNEIEVTPFVSQPVYSGEIDPFGSYNYWNVYPLHAPDFNNHLLIVDGKWVFHKFPVPSPFQTMQEVLNAQKDRELRFHIEPVAVVGEDRKTVRAISRDKDDAEVNQALYCLRHFGSLLDVNMTLALRKMKRRALGLPVDSVPTATFAERHAIASRYTPPASLFQPALAAGFKPPAEKEPDPIWKWAENTEGDRGLAALVREVSAQYQEMQLRDVMRRMMSDKASRVPYGEEQRQTAWDLELNHKHKEAQAKKAERGNV
jgi:hypothetical protein